MHNSTLTKETSKSNINWIVIISLVLIVITLILVSFFFNLSLASRSNNGVTSFNSHGQCLKLLNKQIKDGIPISRSEFQTLVNNCNNINNHILEETTNLLKLLNAELAEENKELQS